MGTRAHPGDLMGHHVPLAAVFPAPWHSGADPSPQRSRPLPPGGENLPRLAPPAPRLPRPLPAPTYDTHAEWFIFLPARAPSVWIASSAPPCWVPQEETSES